MQASVSGQEIKAVMNKIIPAIINTLQDKTSASRREVALRTLGQIVESSGFVVGRSCFLFLGASVSC